MQSIKIIKTEKKHYAAPVEIIGAQERFDPPSSKLPQGDWSCRCLVMQAWPMVVQLYLLLKDAFQDKGNK